MDQTVLPPEMDRAMVLEGLHKKDRDAFLLLLRQWEQPMLQTAQRILQSTSDAEEVRQMVLLQILEKPERLPDAGRFEAWIRRCVINESLNLLRKRKRDDKARRSAALVQQHPSDDPATNVERLDEADSLDQALLELAPIQRAVVSLRFDDGLTIREIAETLDQPHATAHWQLTNAIRQLRSHLGL